jgi:CHASE2 domain-containing sensor protein
MIGDLLEGILQGLMPDLPDGRPGMVIAWLVTVLCAAGAVATYLMGVPRAPAALAACAVALACLLVMGPMVARTTA